MNRQPVPILYEDARGGRNRFGLHELLVSCIADAWDRDWWDLHGHFDAIPKKGDANLLAACREDVPNMRAPLIFAIFDADKIHRRLFETGRPSTQTALDRAAQGTRQQRDCVRAAVPSFDECVRQIAELTR